MRASDEHDRDDHWIAEQMDTALPSTRAGRSAAESRDRLPTRLRLARRRSMRSWRPAPEGSLIAQLSRSGPARPTLAGRAEPPLRLEALRADDEASGGATFRLRRRTSALSRREVVLARSQLDDAHAWLCVLAARLRDSRSEANRAALREGHHFLVEWGAALAEAAGHEVAVVLDRSLEATLGACPALRVGEPIEGVGPLLYSPATLALIGAEAAFSHHLGLIYAPARYVAEPEAPDGRLILAHEIEHGLIEGLTARGPMHTVFRVPRGPADAPQDGPGLPGVGDAYREYLSGSEQRTLRSDIVRALADIDGLARDEAVQARGALRPYLVEPWGVALRVLASARRARASVERGSASHRLITKQGQVMLVTGVPRGARSAPGARDGGRRGELEVIHGLAGRALPPTDGEGGLAAVAMALLTEDLRYAEAVFAQVCALLQAHELVLALVDEGDRARVLGAMRTYAAQPLDVGAKVSLRERLTRAEDALEDLIAAHR